MPLFFLYSPILSFASTDSPNIVISEIAWMGTENSYNDEWIELYNNTDKSISLDGWTLLSLTKNSPNIKLSGSISGYGFFILERTDDSTLPKIKSSQIYKGNLGNKGEHLRLIDNQGKMIDEVNCSSQWFAGDNKAKKTMERINMSKSDIYNLGNSSDNWQTSKDCGGTPKAKNSKKLNKKNNEKFENTAFIAKSAIRDSNQLRPCQQILNKSFIAFLIALIFAIFSAKFFLIIKKRTNTRP
ncbi:MAG: lamin tail domain-containing protein [Patescibacteria group bacterium]|nr:lamin tail domain-containing protein [Patescibacteria group bacterium]